jgi:hypothetical protein
MSVFYALETAVVPMPTGEQIAIRKGEPYPADHPVVIRCPGYFSEDPIYGMHARETVEQATGNPGEKRNVRRG